MRFESFPRANESPSAMSGMSKSPDWLQIRPRSSVESELRPWGGATELSYGGKGRVSRGSQRQREREQRLWALHV